MTPTFLSLDLVELRQNMSEHCVTGCWIFPLSTPHQGSSSLQQAGHRHKKWVEIQCPTNPPTPSKLQRWHSHTAFVIYHHSVISALIDSCSFLAASRRGMTWMKRCEKKNNMMKEKGAWQRNLQLSLCFFPSINRFLCPGDSRVGFGMQILRTQEVGMVPLVLPLHMWRKGSFLSLEVTFCFMVLTPLNTPQSPSAQENN